MSDHDYTFMNKSDYLSFIEKRNWTLKKDKVYNRGGQLVGRVSSKMFANGEVFYLDVVYV